MLKNLNIRLLLIPLLFMVQSCSIKKFIPEDKWLYKGAEIEFVSENPVQAELKTELQNTIEPEPSSTTFGTNLGLYYYYKAQRDNPGFINKFLNKRIGVEPVYLEEADPAQTEEILVNRLENNGYFYSRVDYQTEQYEQKKTAKIFYRVQLRESPYVLENYAVDHDSLQIYRQIQQTLGDAVPAPGQPFDLTQLKLERERIDRELKSQGYYNFSSNFLIFEADTNQYDRKKFDLFVRLKEEVPEEGIKPYVISEINVYPNFVVGSDSLERRVTRYNNKNYIQNEIFFEPEKLDPFIVLEEGELYNPLESAMTSRRLTAIGAYKFVNIRYDVVDSLSTDSLGYLQTNIFLSPLNKRAIRVELQALTKSNSFAGPHLAVTYSNRNLFRGGEILNVTANAGYEAQLSGGKQPGQTSIQLGVEGDLVFPRMLFPIDINDNWFEYSIPKTKVSAGFEYLRRSQLFGLTSISSSFGYIWKANRYITHQLDPLSLHYVQPVKTTPRFQALLDDNAYLRSSFEQKFIAGLNYSFLYNGMVDVEDTHQFFFNSNVNIAGNTLDLLSNGPTPKKFLGLEFAQFFTIDADLRYHYNFAGEQTIAARLFGGIGIPYGNSEILPFSRQFFAGGPYSIRAFQVRRLGPGSFKPQSETNLTYYDQMGNVQLEANLEYRFPIYSFLKGALFTDAGNVWNTGKTFSEEDKPLTDRQIDLIEKGTFGPEFLDEVAVGVGAGLRVDIQNFVIRLDLGFPLRTPWLPEGQRWEFRFKDPVLNFAIGYPF